MEDLSASTPSAPARKTELGSGATLRKPEESENDEHDGKSVQSASTGKHSGRKTERKSHVQHGDKETLGEKRRKSRKSRPAAKKPAENPNDMVFYDDY